MENLQQNTRTVSEYIPYLPSTLPVIVFLNTSQTRPYGFREFWVKRLKITKRINFIPTPSLIFWLCDQPWWNKLPLILWWSLQHIPTNYETHTGNRRLEEYGRRGINRRKLWYLWAFEFWSGTGRRERQFKRKWSSIHDGGNSHCYNQG